MSLLTSLNAAKIFTFLLICLSQQAHVPACILDAKAHSAPSQAYNLPEKSIQQS